jgi:hypothetical protein
MQNHPDPLYRVCGECFAFSPQCVFKALYDDPRDGRGDRKNLRVGNFQATGIIYAKITDTWDERVDRVGNYRVYMMRACARASTIIRRIYKKNSDLASYKPPDYRPYRPVNRNQFKSLNISISMIDIYRPERICYLPYRPVKLKIGMYSASKATVARGPWIQSEGGCPPGSGTVCSARTPR